VLVAVLTCPLDGGECQFHAPVAYAKDIAVGSHWIGRFVVPTAVRMQIPSYGVWRPHIVVPGVFETLVLICKLHGVMSQ
jgi:hypothetical protein